MIATSAMAPLRVGLRAAVAPSAFAARPAAFQMAAARSFATSELERIAGSYFDTPGLLGEGSCECTPAHALLWTCADFAQARLCRCALPSGLRSATPRLVSDCLPACLPACRRMPLIACALRMRRCAANRHCAAFQAGPRLTAAPSCASFRTLPLSASRLHLRYAAYIKGTVNDPTTYPAPNAAHGSYHWAVERLISVGLVPLFAVAGVKHGASGILDGALALTLIVHSHIGFDAILADYLHKRKYPIMGPIGTWGVRAATLGAIYGFYGECGAAKKCLLVPSIVARAHHRLQRFVTGFQNSTRTTLVRICSAATLTSHWMLTFPLFLAISFLSLLPGFTELIAKLWTA